MFVVTGRGPPFGSRSASFSAPLTALVATCAEVAIGNNEGRRGCLLNRDSGAENPWSVPCVERGTVLQLPRSSLQH